MKSPEIIVAVGRNLEIGKGNDLIWPIREDLKRFKILTMGHPLIMGRLTWESLPKKPLPGRLNIVISRNRDYVAPGALLCGSLEEALEAASGQTLSPFVIGGASLYRAALPFASYLHLTRIDAEEPMADAYFPEIPIEDWSSVELSEPAEAEVKGRTVSYRFETLVRK